MRGVLFQVITVSMVGMTGCGGEPPPGPSSAPSPTPSTETVAPDAAPDPQPASAGTDTLALKQNKPAPDVVQPDRTTDIEKGAVASGCRPGILSSEYDGKTLTLQICPNLPLELDEFIGYREPCSDCETLWVGATARTTTDSTHLDLPAVEIPSADRGKPVTLSAALDSLEDVSWGVWSQKTDTTTCERHGCSAYGYLLDGKLRQSAFQPITPSRVMVIDAGGGATRTQKAVDVSEGFDGGVHEQTRDYTEIYYRSPTHHSGARELADRLEKVGHHHIVLTHWPESPEALVVLAGS